MDYLNDRRYEPFRVEQVTSVLPPVETVQKFPKIKNFYDVIEKREELIRAVESNKDVDIIYRFANLWKNTSTVDKATRMVKPLPKEFVDTPWNWCIAGSSALSVTRQWLQQAINHSKYKNLESTVKTISKLLGLNPDMKNPDSFLTFVSLNFNQLTSALDEQKKAEALRCLEKYRELTSYLAGDFTPNDADIFFLGSPVPHRMTMPTFDIVHSKDKTVEELLLNFDLPCCRAAYNSRYDFWISAQCLYALLTGIYYLPAYTQDSGYFAALLQKHRNKDPFTMSEKQMFDRFQKRVKKYQTRGFKCLYIQTETVLPWIINRFHYGEWKLVPNNEI